MPYAHGHMNLNVHSILPFSRANGPGARAVIWVQGCSLGCPGCFNPGTHPFVGGDLISTDDLFERIVSLGATIQGITVSGGEPLQQRAALLDFLTRIRRETPLSVILFTGFTWEEVTAMPDTGRLFASVDVLIAGRYVEARRLARALRGSTNKTVHVLTERYTRFDLEATPDSEIVLLPDGRLVVSGISPVRTSSSFTDDS